MTTKYIRTSKNEIIVFTDLLVHSDFKRFEPISAGFIIFGTNEDNDLVCTCYGESVSLELKSMADDSALATKQIIKHNNMY